MVVCIILAPRRQANKIRIQVSADAVATTAVIPHGASALSMPCPTVETPCQSLKALYTQTTGFGTTSSQAPTGFTIRLPTPIVSKPSARGRTLLDGCECFSTVYKDGS